MDFSGEKFTFLCTVARKYVFLLLVRDNGSSSRGRGGREEYRGMVGEERGGAEREVYRIEMGKMPPFFPNISEFWLLIMASENRTRALHCSSE